MNKRKIKKLEIRQETIQILNRQELREVRGATNRRSICFCEYDSAGYETNCTSCF